MHTSTSTVFQLQVMFSSQTIGAMNQCEELTDLGYQLADLPIEPHLGKMVLCAVVLKCLDPILTIACTLAYRDPFIIPVNSSEKRAALQGRHRFSCNSFSDHMALLRAFQVHGVINNCYLGNYSINEGMFLTYIIGHVSSLCICHFINFEHQALKTLYCDNLYYCITTGI